MLRLLLEAHLMKTRFPLALPFAVLASLVAGCSSSSGAPVTTDGGTSDTGIVHHDAATNDGGTKDTGAKSDAVADATKDSGMVTPPTDGGTGVTVPAGAKSIASGIIDARFMTTDDYIVYFDATGGISASDIAGNVTQIAPGPTTDGGIGPALANQGGSNIVAVFTDYTTKTVDSETEIVEGTLSIWSHTLGTLKQIATHSTGAIAIANDGSYVAYSDSSNATGTTGNIGIVAGDGTGAVDVATSVSLDLTAAVCFPFGLFDGKVAVLSTCAVTDAGLGSPSITAYNGAAAWAPTVLTATAGPSSLNAAGELVAINEAADTVGGNALIVTPAAGTSLSSIPVGGGAPTSLTSMFGAPSGGQSSFYITPDGTAAYFTNTDGSYGKSTFATPGGLPTTKTLAAAGSVFGVQVFSSDGKYDVDYGTASDATTMQPTSLNVRDLSTGTAKALIQSGSSIASTFGTVNGFTADNSYVIFTADLKAVGSTGDATAGNLQVAPVTTGVAVSINPSQSVWNANPLTGTKLIYNVNYIPNPDFTMLPNGAATADMYIADATVAGPGTLLISGADAPNYFYVTADKKHMFFTFTVLALPEGGNTGVPVNGDGLYSIALP
jgi:fibronectin-binding autotransporter adhesin